MTDESYVFDTYAMIEIIAGNPNYKEYVNAKVFILAEFCLAMLRRFNTERAFDHVDKVARFVASVNNNVMKEAILYRFKNQKRNLTATDCIGYFLAKNLGVKFLTGDKEFKNLANVEFIK